MTSSKLKLLAYVKNDNVCENYLLSVENIRNRTALTKFRLSNHSLMIEKGRYQKADICDRTCPFCTDQIEDEFHFLLKCPTYRQLRCKLLDAIRTTTKGFYYPQNEQFLFWFVLKNPLIANMTGNFIRLAMELRAFLLENPRKRDWCFYLVYLPITIRLFVYTHFYQGVGKSPRTIFRAKIS